MTRILAMLLLTTFLSACGVETNEDHMTFTRLSEVPREKLEVLSQKSYFFGHQSVGRNMVDGLRLVMADNTAIRLNIQESESVANAAPGSFLHANVGKNRLPQSKIDHFRTALDSGLGNAVDVAFLKFCYVDLTQKSDTKALFAQYQAAVAGLQAKYPETTFVHFTMPVKSVPTGLKTTIKHLIGREIAEEAENIRRAEYNALLRAAYESQEPVFDIARLESIDPVTGKAFSFTVAGKQYEAMAPSNTDDGGHLTDTGKRWIAEQLLILLANLE